MNPTNGCSTCSTSLLIKFLNSANDSNFPPPLHSYALKTFVAPFHYHHFQQPFIYISHCIFSYAAPSLLNLLSNGTCPPHHFHSLCLTVYFAQPLVPSSSIERVNLYQHCADSKSSCSQAVQRTYMLMTVLVLQFHSMSASNENTGYGSHKISQQFSFPLLWPEHVIQQFFLRHRPQCYFPLSLVRRLRRTVFFSINSHLGSWRR